MRSKSIFIQLQSVVYVLLRATGVDLPQTQSDACYDLSFNQDPFVEKLDHCDTASIPGLAGISELPISISGPRVGRVLKQVAIIHARTLYSLYSSPMGASARYRRMHL